MMHSSLICILLLFVCADYVNSIGFNMLNDDSRIIEKTNELSSSLTDSTTNRLTVYAKHKLMASSCQCLNYSCSCCSHVEVDRINLNDTACVNLTYLSDDIGLRITFDIDNVIYYDREVSVRNPPPLCFGVPYLKEGAQICLKLYNVTWNVTYSGCIDLVAYLLDIRVAQIKIGCFKFGNHTFSRSQQGSYILSIISKSENSNSTIIQTILSNNSPQLVINDIRKFDVMMENIFKKLWNMHGGSNGLDKALENAQNEE